MLRSSVTRAAAAFLASILLAAVPSPADVPPLALQALSVLREMYVDPVDPLRLVNAAIAGLRSSTHLPPDAVPPAAGGSLPDIEAAYVDRLERAAAASGRPAAELDRAATSAMLASLHDSHTSYLPPDEYAEEEASLSGQPSYSGIGILFGQAPDPAGTRWLYVSDVIPGSPADIAGLRRFDRLVAADGRSLANAGIDDAIALIRGQPGTIVTLSVARQGRPLTFVIRRAPITARPVSATALMPGVLWVRLRSFAVGASDDLRDALASASRAGRARAIVLDLRDNPGGLVAEAEAVLGLFLPSQAPLAIIADRTGSSTLRASGIAAFPSTPLVVLVNGNTASASEIVAIALKDAGRAALVGERSAGALGAAVTVPLSDGGMSVTVARILGPKGEAIDGVGVTPDIPSRLQPQDIWKGRDAQLEDALRALATTPAGSR